MRLQQKSQDLWFKVVLRACASVSGGVLLVMIIFVCIQAFPAFNEPGLSRMVMDDAWSPTSNQFNMVPMLVGTVAVTLGSLLITAPLGIGSAVFMRFYAPKHLAWVFRRLVEILAGVPSVVYGLWGLAVVVPLIAEVSPFAQGQSLLAGTLVLALMTLPIVVVASDAAMESVPVELIRAGAALGLARHSVVWRVVIPAARNGILGGVVLQVGRAIGETMAVLMVCGNIVELPESVFSPVRTLTANIALEMGYADDRHRSALFVTGLVLLLLVIITVCVLELLARIEQLKSSLKEAE